MCSALHAVGSLQSAVCTFRLMQMRSCHMIETPESLSSVQFFVCFLDQKPRSQLPVASCIAGVCFFFATRATKGGRGGESAKSGNSAKNLFHFIQPD